jgi:RHS repeat-associated protein
VRAIDAAGNLSAYSNVASAATQGGQLYYIVPDHLNTPRLIADSTGTTVWKWDQGEPFGNDVPNNNPSGAGAFDFPLRFPGQYFDKETNLSYNMRRDYDMSVGRYVQSDPIGLRAGLNTYAYVSNKPLIAKDPFGLAKWTGTVNSIGVEVWGRDEFELESECKCGYKLRTVVKATYFSFGFSAIRSRSKVEFEDHFDCPNAMAFDGEAFKVSLGGGIGDGRGFDFIVLGRATSPGHWSSFDQVFGGSADVNIGWSDVGPVRSEDCGCKQGN